jgi:hypothetical protein
LRSLRIVIAEQALVDLLKNPPGPGARMEKPKEEPPDFEMLCDDV